MKIFESTRQRGESHSSRWHRNHGVAELGIPYAIGATPPTPLAVLRLEEIIAGAVHANRAFAARARVLVDVAFGRGGTRIRGHASQLTGVFHKLLRSATNRSAPNGTVEIRVYPSGDRDVAVSVRDHGVPTGARRLDAVFGPAPEGPVAAAFECLAPAGRPVARCLAELHGGTVAVHDFAPDQGSEFVVTLATATATHLSVVAPAEPRIAPLRILVVDDHHDSADTLRALLGVDGHTVAVAYEGGGVVALAERFRPDVILLDLDLPDISGYEVARRLRAVPDHSRLIALTGYGGDRYRATAAEAGFEHFLLKPVDLAALRKVLVPHRTPLQREPAGA